MSRGQRVTLSASLVLLVWLLGLGVKGNGGLLDQFVDDWVEVTEFFQHVLLGVCVVSGQYHEE